MEILTDIKERGSIENNKVMLEKENAEVYLKDTRITFKGNNNILYLEDGVKIYNSTIIFEGDDSVVFLCKNKEIYYLNITMYNNNAFYMGQDNYMNGKINAILSEQKHIVIGDGGIFSFGIWLRIADPHLVYDSETMMRKNQTRSIFIGDHVWIGQSSMILKGTKIGSGGVVGAMALVAGKKISSNTIWGGNPAKEIERDVFFTNTCVHRFKEKETEESMKFTGEKFIYKEDSATKNFDIIDKELSGCKTSEKLLKYMKDNIRYNVDKNRFYVGGQEKSRNFWKK